MPENQTKKLNLFGVTSLTLVALIGTGMFFGPAIAASFAGPAALVAWIILGLETIYVGFIFAELASMFPKAGGIYEFAKQAYGRFPSFLIGWTMWLVATINTAVLIVAALQYSFPMLTLSQQMIASLFLLIILHFIAYRGLGATEVVLDFFAASLLVFVILTIFGGYFHVDPTNYQPFFTQPKIMLALALFYILETFFGWETACFFAEETNNPTKTIPRAIIISSGVGAVLGIALAAVLYGIIPAGSVAQNTPLLANVFALVYGDIGSTILRIGVFLALIGSAAGNVVSQPRLLLAMARDKLFITQLNKRSEKTNAPTRAIIFQAVVSGIVLIFALGSYTLLLSLLVPMALIMYVPIFLAVPVLREKQPGIRPFHCPFPYSGPIIASLVFVVALAGWIILDPLAFSVLRFMGSLLAFGLPIYLLLSLYYNPSTQLMFSDALAYPALFFETIIVPERLREKMLSLFKTLKGKTVLELGAGVGSFTMHLAEAVKPGGKVIAVEAGKNNVDLLLKRIEKSEHQHVTTIHDAYANNRLHPDVKRVDAVYSLGMLGYLQNIQKVLKEISAVMPEAGKVCFVEWVDYFGILPNPHYLTDMDEIRKEFERAGFRIRIEKMNGLFWNYLIVYGVKTDQDVPFI